MLMVWIYHQKTLFICLNIYSVFFRKTPKPFFFGYKIAYLDADTVKASHSYCDIGEFDWV